ncbi:MAG: hypothetical protein AB7N65_25980 [Vicinamibacterales bacterium]
MADLILIDGDQVIFNPTFGQAVVVVRPGRLAGSGPATRGGKALCVDGDESKVSVPGCMYIAGPYAIPGVGTLKIKQLAANQKATKTKSGKKAVLLKGGSFIAEFQVNTPAQQPPPGPGSPIPDGTPQYAGSGMFVTTNVKFFGT